MEYSPNLKLFGNWASFFVHRVQVALKLKGLQYEYMEEDLSNKSPSLLLYNPVYQKVPVLLHDGRPISESLVILEYIDETWKHSPVLPQDPYDRAVVRFWCHFVCDKLIPSAGKVFLSSGEKQREAITDFLANMNLLEGELRQGHFKGRRFLGGDHIDLLDIVIGCGSHWFFMLEEFCGAPLLHSDAFPCFCSWYRDFNELDVVKEVIPEKDKLLDYARVIRSRFMPTAESDNENKD